MSERTDKFIHALKGLEEGGDAEGIAALFSADADVSNPLVKHSGEGKQGALDFWTKYRAAFDAIHSEFRNVVEEGDVAMLEWTSEGRADGQPVKYGGVSVLEFADDAVRTFRTYFDSRQVLPRPLP